MEIPETDVASSPDAASTEVAESSTAVNTETLGAENQQAASSVTAPDATQSTTETQADDDPLKDVPSLEELQKLTEQKVPYSQALAKLRPAYEGLKSQVDEYKALDPWREFATSVGDPTLAKSSYELVSAIHTPSQENPSGFTSIPFLQRLETESSGTVDQIFSDTLTFQVPDIVTGQPSTVVRNLYKSHGLDPDRIDDYRNIDKLRASGVVNVDDLSGIPEKYHPAFKALSDVQREDILAQRPVDRDGNKLAYNAATFDYLQDKAEALEARQWREQNEKAKADAKAADDAKFQSDLEVAVEQDIYAEVKSIHDSIHQSLASQLKFAGDEAVNNLEYDKILSTLATLQNPAYRFVAERALKQVGISLDGFDELANRWSERRSAYKTFDAMGDKWQAQRALSESTIAKQQLLAKLNDYALRLGKASGERAAAASTQVASQLGAAQGRFVPSGNGAAQQGSQNPYEQNPHQIGSQEYYAFNRKVDKEYSLTNASVFGG